MTLPSDAELELTEALARVEEWGWLGYLKAVGAENTDGIPSPLRCAKDAE